MDFKRVMNFGLLSYAVLSLVVLTAAIPSVNKATFPELGALALVNVLSSGVGMARITRVRASDESFNERIGKIGAEHSWLTLSVTTAVLALLYGNYFKDTFTSMVLQEVFLTIITLISIYLIVEVARRKITFLD